MTIRPGESWGEPCDVDPEWPRTDNDHGVVAAAPGPVVLVGGDLHRTLGGRGGPVAVRYEIDLLDVELDGVGHVAAAHAVARSIGWSGAFLVAMNAAYLRSWYLGPRAHPNDGLADVTEGHLAPGQRWQARRRAFTGSHLPHPDLLHRRTGEHHVVFDRPRTLWVDGRRVGRGRSVTVSVRPDAVSVVVPPAT